jgi:hypothetical protein
MIKSKRVSEPHIVSEPDTDYNIIPFRNNHILLERKSDGKLWEFYNTSEAGVFVHMLYRVGGDEANIITPAPINTYIKIKKLVE